VKQWQQKNQQGDLEKPPDNAWYWNLRCKLIEEDRLTVYHCWDACRNSVKDKIKALEQEQEQERAAASRARNPAQDIN